MIVISGVAEIMTIQHATDLKASSSDSGKFCDFVTLCNDIEAVSAHSEKTSIMENFLEKFKGDVYLLYKLLFAKEDKRKFNLKDKKLVDIAAGAFGEDHDDMLEHMESKGDVSETLKKYLIRSKNAADKGSVSLKQVDDFLEKLTTLTKKDEQERAFDKFVTGKLTGDEVKFLTRIICKDLKIRAGPKFLLAALHSDAYSCYILTHDLKQIVDAVINHEDLKNLSMTMQTQSVDIDALIRDAGSDDDDDNKKKDFMDLSDDSDSKPSKSSKKPTSSKDTDKKDKKKKAASDSDDDDTDIDENIDEEKAEEMVDEEEVASGKKKKKAAAKKIKVKAKMVLFNPVKPMLARPSKTYDDIIKRCPNGFYCELKYDGERIQIHYDRSKDKIKYFSRNLKEVQEYKIESVKKYISRAIKQSVSSVILDGEILLMDTVTKKPLPFAAMGKNKRVNYPNAVTCVFLFDILLYNGKSLLSVPLNKRKALMSKIVDVIDNRVMLGEVLIVKGSKQTREAIVSSKMQEMIDAGEEGLVLKDLLSPYEPSARHWLKMKKDYLSGMADSVDLVVLGAYYGTGSKGNLMSVFLMGCYDEKRKEWKTVCKAGNGHDDNTINQINDELKSNMKKISKDPSQVPDNINIMTNAIVPDFIVKDPYKSCVWEITGAEFSSSSVHSTLISIRFPRVTKIRDDKGVKDATTFQELIKLEKESSRKPSVPLFPKKGKSAKSDDDDNDDESDDAKNKKKRKTVTKKKKDSSDDENSDDDKSDDSSSSKKKKKTDTVSSSASSSSNSNKKASSKNKISDIKDVPDSKSPEEIYYLYGDFGKIPTNKDKRFIAHCVDDSNRWGDKGSMGNVTLNFGDELKNIYVDDMNNLGDVQVVQPPSQDHLYLSNLICLQFVQKGKPPKIDYSALEECLKKCATHMIDNQITTFHLFRLHFGIPGLDWGRVEKMLKDIISNKGVAVFVYTKDKDDKDKVTESQTKLKNRKEKSKDAAAAVTDVAVSEAKPASSNNDNMDMEYTSKKSKAPIFEDVIVFISGYPADDYNTIAELVRSNGGKVTNSWQIIGDSNTHLICETENSDFTHCSCLGACIVTKNWVLDSVAKGKVLDTDAYAYPPPANSSQTKPAKSLLQPPAKDEPFTSLCDLFTGCTIYLHKDVPAQKMHTRYIIGFDGDVQSSLDDNTTHIITSSTCMNEELANLKKRNPSAKIVSNEWIWHSINTKQLVDWSLHEIQ